MAHSPTIASTFPSKISDNGSFSPRSPSLPSLNGSISSSTKTIPVTKEASPEPGENPPNLQQSELEHPEPESSLNRTLDLDMELETVGSDPSSSVGEPAYHPENSDETRRVKVYELMDNKWVDKGTAFCQSAYDEETQMAKLIARSEEIPDEVILQFYIRGEDVYQRQQDTLIVWTEPDGTDYALSFQDIEGCADVWEYILDVQRAINGDRERDENDEPLSSRSPPGGGPITFTSIVHASQLPPPQFGIMLEVERAINHVGRNANLRDRLCEHIITTDYIRRMVDLAAQAEDLEQLEDLHALCSCMQTILLLNDHSIFEHVTSDDAFMGVCGILEYDPDFPNHKACYREILGSQSHFKQPIPFEEEAIKRKIHQTYRLQFLKDVVLTRVLEDSTFTVLNSCIIFNQIDLINHFTSDEVFLRQVVNLFVNPSLFSTKKGKAWETAPVPSSPSHDSSDDILTLDERRRDVIFLIQQLCVMGKNVQLQARLLLFRALVDRGFIHAVQWGLSTSNDVLMGASAEVLAVLLDHDINGIRNHIMRQAEVDPHQSLVNVLSQALASGRGDQALRHQLADCLKSLLETQLPEGVEGAATGIKAFIRQREDPIIEKFLEFVYNKGHIKLLFRSLFDMPEFKSLQETPLTLTHEKSTLYFHLLEVLCCIIQQHGFRGTHYILESSISPRVASLLSSAEKHLRLGALRVFRSCLKQNNRNLTHHLIKHDVFSPIIDMTTREARRDNLMSSACQEFFEYIRKENSKELVSHIMMEHEKSIRTLAKGNIVGTRFQNLIRRWEQNNEPPPPVSDVKKEDSHLYQYDRARGLDTEEDDWFNGSDEEDSGSPKTTWVQQQQIRLSQGPTLKRKRAPPAVEYPLRRRQFPPSPTPTNSPPSMALVDYEDEDASPSNDDAENSKLSPALKVPQNTSQNGGLVTTSREKPPKPIKIPVLSTVADVHPVPSLPSQDKDPSPNLSPTTVLPPTRLAKRQRDEDEDDEWMARLAAKSKLTGLSETRDDAPLKQPSIRLALGKMSEGAKKIKLNLGLGRKMESGMTQTKPTNKDDERG